MRWRMVLQYGRNSDGVLEGLHPNDEALKSL